MLQHMGFNQHNTTFRNWGLEDEDNEKLIEMLGDSFFDDIKIDKTKCLVRILRYDPGHCIPLHSDGYMEDLQISLEKEPQKILCCR